MISAVQKIISEVLRLLGATMAQTSVTGRNKGIHAAFISLMTSCFVAKVLARYIKSASLAISDVWNVLLIRGIIIHLLALFISYPNNNVYTSNTKAIRRN